MKVCSSSFSFSFFLLILFGFLIFKSVRFYLDFLDVSLMLVTGCDPPPCSDRPPC